MDSCSVLLDKPAMLEGARNAAVCLVSEDDVRLPCAPASCVSASNNVPMLLFLCNLGTNGKTKMAPTNIVWQLERIFLMGELIFYI